jgi:cation diffusion facilitator family transporter
LRVQLKGQVAIFGGEFARWSAAMHDHSVHSPSGHVHQHPSVAEAVRINAPHAHVFLGAQHARHERRTWIVVALTAAMMVVEIIAGYVFGSMALVADGWHMSTHASALAIAALAYRFARRHMHDPRFSFGTGKLGDLAAFASAILLALVALFIGFESVSRLVAPVTIHYGEAMWVAVIGLLVNLATAAILFDSGHHGHEHGHAHGHAHDDHGDHGHDRDAPAHDTRDHNIRAAYVHVLADALTSVFAIVALGAGSLYGIAWLDPVMGVVGALIIAQWSVSLIRAAGAVLLDMVPDTALCEAVRARLETEGARITDLHVWRLGPGHNGVIVSVLAQAPLSPEACKQRLAGIAGLSHVTVEVRQAEAA